jgi:hypothetical protein
MQITLNLPQDVAQGLAVKWADLPPATLESLALEGYRAGVAYLALYFSSRLVP